MFLLVLDFEAALALAADDAFFCRFRGRCCVARWLGAGSDGGDDETRRVDERRGRPARAAPAALVAFDGRAAAVAVAAAAVDDEEDGEDGAAASSSESGCSVRDGMEVEVVQLVHELERQVVGFGLGRTTRSAGTP